MSALTDEQRRIIEQKKKAAEIIKKQKSLQGNGPAPPNLSVNKVISNANTPQSKPANFYNGNSTNSYSATKNPGSSYSSKAVAASCTLISEDRFVVNMPYHSPSIEMFKTIPGREYDAKVKLWTFPVSSYDALMGKFQDLKPGVIVGGIPKNVLTAMKAPSPDLESIDLSKIDKVLLGSLMPFQEYGVRFGISRGGRCLIADDMGLGKTIQALGIAHYYKENWPLLIICPSSMRFPWEEAVQTFLPSVSPFSITVMTTTKDLINEARVVICSYDLMKSSLQDLQKKRFGVIILDESHSLKNFKTARTKASAECAKRCTNVILLSGTPALSRPIELYPQINVIDPTAFRTVSDFGLRYCDGKHDKFGWNFQGSSNMQELEIFLKKKIMIRRLKSEVISQLPSKLRKVIVLHPGMVKAVSKQMRAFESQMEMQKGMEKRSTLMQWFTVTGTTKITAVCDYLKDKLESTHKFLVFGHHVEVLNGISDLLIKENVKFIRIDGTTSAEQRKVNCDKFQTEDNCRVAVLSIKAANSGITLTAASLVIFAELYWNPGELTQAEDRAHRIGQHDSVVVEYLVAKGTADDHIWKLIQSKLNVLNKAGLSKDNFKEVSTEHLAEKLSKASSSSTLTIPEMFKNINPVENRKDDGEEVKTTNPIENRKDDGEKVKNTNPIENNKRDSEDDIFEDLGDMEDDVFANINLEGIETDYEVETKKRKTTF